MSTIECVHCGAFNEVGAQFCESCGKVIAVEGGGGPRILSEDEIATSDSGKEVHGDLAFTKARSAARSILVIAVLQTLGVFLFFGLAQSDELGPEEKEGLMFVVYVLTFIAAVFWGIWYWSRSNPFVASIVGLVLISTLYIADAIVDPSQIAKGIIIKIIIIYYLIQAVKHGAEHRKIVQSM